VIAAATIVARNYIPQARVVAQSFRRHHPDIPFFVLLVDRSRDAIADATRIALPEVFTPPRRYSIKQTAVAAKPFLLQWLLAHGFDRCLFLDPDVLVLSRFDALLERIGQHSVVVTPHFVTPPRDEQRIARELNILLSGVFNGGLIGIADRQPAREFLKWWGERVIEACDSEVARGLYYDQRWLDLAPVFFRDISVLRDAAYNVAYWNLPERELRVEGDSVTVDGRACAFIHFSGFDPARPQQMTRYAPQTTISNAMFARYAALLREAGAR